jgi:hypothetical protein
MSESLVFSTEAPKLSLEITVDGKPVTLKFKDVNQVPAQTLFYGDGEGFLDSSTIMVETLKWSLDPASWKILLSLPMISWKNILGEMSRASDADLGKSPASSNSSKSTARRSKQSASTADSD